MGAGGLGCPALQYLAAAGIGVFARLSFVTTRLTVQLVYAGTLGIIDHDVVELSNLQRQILHTSDRIDMFKALSAKEAIRQYVWCMRVPPYSPLTPSSAG